MIKGIAQSAYQCPRFRLVPIRDEWDRTRAALVLGGTQIVQIESIISLA